MFLKKIVEILTCIIISICVISIPLSSYAEGKNQRPFINILTWWGYLNLVPKQLKQIENTCHVNISYDTYYSNNQFINRFQKSEKNYDIVIFSKTILNSVKDKINLTKSKLYTVSKNYNSIIRKQYTSEKLPHNMVYFQQSLTGFLYNPKNININENDSIKSIFKKSSKYLIVMIDDPVEANFLMSLLLKKKEGLHMKEADQLSLTWKNFKKIVRNSKILITNNPNKIIKLKNFGFAFQWSGDAIQEMAKNKGDLKFIILPKLSYISSDLLAEVNLKQKTRCVAQKLASKPFLDSLQNKSYYFSPFLNMKSISHNKNKYFKSIYLQTIKHIKNIPWIVSVSINDFNKIKSSWAEIKYKLRQENE